MVKYHIEEKANDGCDVSDMKTREENHHHPARAGCSAKSVIVCRGMNLSTRSQHIFSTQTDHRTYLFENRKQAEKKVRRVRASCLGFICVVCVGGFAFYWMDCSPGCSLARL